MVYLKSLFRTVVPSFGLFYSKNSWNEMVSNTPLFLRIIQLQTERLKSPRNKSSQHKWDVGKVVEVCGTKKYLVEIGDNIQAVHVDQMIPAKDEPKLEYEPLTYEFLPEGETVQTTVPETPKPNDVIKETELSDQNQGSKQEQIKPTVQLTLQSVRRSGRLRKPVIRLDL